MELQRNFKPFMFSCIVWHEVGDKVAFTNTLLMEDTLNEHLRLADYGTGIAEIVFFYVAVTPDNNLHGETLRYTKKSKEVFAQIKLPYELVEQYEPPQVLQLMAATYLSTIRKLRKRTIPDFDHDRFEQDVAQLFEKQGWLQREMAS